MTMSMTMSVIFSPSTTTNLIQTKCMLLPCKAASTTMMSSTITRSLRSAISQRVVPFLSHTTTTSSSKRASLIKAAAAGGGSSPYLIDALIFDCDGVIVESEDIHRRAYNAAFEKFNVVCPGESATIDWTVEYYDMLQNKVGGGKPKMRWYFGQKGWPTSSVLDGRTAEMEEEKTMLVDVLQAWKTEKYKDIIGSGEVSPRPGILQLMDDARAAGIPVAVCSASTKGAVVFVLGNLLGKERFASLDLFMAGDDVPLKKPDPTIYRVAAERLQLDPSKCLVIEDSLIGLQAALGAGMKCVITYTSGSIAQEFTGATAVLESMDGVVFEDLARGKCDGKDSRVAVHA